MPTLLDLTEDIIALQEALDDVEGNITGQEEAVAAFFAETEEAFADKADRYAALIIETTQRAGVRKAEAKRLVDLAKADENRARWLKHRLMGAMDAIGETRIVGKRHNVNVQKNGGKAAMHIDDEEMVPNRFFERVPQLNKDALREALEAGEEVAGARLEERGRSLRIR